MCGHSPACPPCSAVHASASSGASTSPAIATAAHCHGPSGSSAEMRKCASRRGGACIPPAGATAVIAGASVVEADLVDQHAGLAAVAYHFGQRQRVELNFIEAREQRVEFDPGLHRVSIGRAHV